MKNKPNYIEKIKEILVRTCGQACTNGSERDYRAVAEIMNLLEEQAAGFELEEKSVEELKDVMPEAFNDLASRVAFKEGYNQKVKELKGVK